MEVGTASHTFMVGSSWFILNTLSVLVWCSSMWLNLCFVSLYEVSNLCLWLCYHVLTAISPVSMGCFTSQQF